SMSGALWWAPSRSGKPVDSDPVARPEWLAQQFVEAFPDQLFIIDHLAKPPIRSQGFEPWASQMEEIAQYENVYCKISGMVTEADWNLWKPADFWPYLDHMINCFGMNRILYGSDWPVCLLGGTYGEVKAIVDEYFKGFSADEKTAFYSGNAMRFYHL
ncbi:MAG: amidohydrolase, partial [Bacteroidota bacterium]|nr:amidohydrolase [Bacteroidota bacterium]